jgi:hypothetical protein
LLPWQLAAICGSRRLAVGGENVLVVTGVASTTVALRKELTDILTAAAQAVGIIVIIVISVLAVVIVNVIIRVAWTLLIIGIVIVTVLTSFICGNLLARVNTPPNHILTIIPDILRSIPTVNHIGDCLWPRGGCVLALCGLSQGLHLN